MKPATVAFRGRYSDELLEAIDWAMEVDPLLRPQHVPAFLEALTKPPCQEVPESAMTRLANALGRYLGEAVQVAIQLEGAKAETPAQAQARLQDERQQAAVRSIQEDDNVKALEEAFGAQVRTESIQPVE